MKVLKLFIHVLDKFDSYVKTCKLNFSDFEINFVKNLLMGKW